MTTSHLRKLWPRATGAGAEMRRNLGIAVFAGMLGVTFCGLLLTPVFYYVLQAISDWRRPPSGPHGEPHAPAGRPAASAK